jgi:hypothetical protein
MFEETSVARAIKTHWFEGKNVVSVIFYYY